MRPSPLRCRLPRGLYLLVGLLLAAPAAGGCRMLGLGGGDDPGSRSHGYDYDRALLWRAATEVLQAEGYTLRVADAVTGRILSEPRTVRSGDAYQVALSMGGPEGSLSLAVKVRHLRRSGDDWREDGNAPVLERRILELVEAKANTLVREGMRSPAPPAPRSRRR